MADIPNKLVTAESIKTLHEYNQDTYLPFIGGTVTGNLGVDGITTVKDYVVFANNNRGIVGVDESGNQYHQFQPVNDSGNCVVGYGMYNAGVGSTNIYGNTIGMCATNDSRMQVVEGGLAIETASGLTLNNDIHFDTNNTSRIYATDSNGVEFNVFHGKNAYNNTAIGYDNYHQSSGNLNLYGNGIRIWSKEAELEGRAYGVNKLLWNGTANRMGKYNGAIQHITLSGGKISAQPHGAVLMWSWYDVNEGVAKNYDWHYFFVPKHHVLKSASGAGVCFHLGLAGLGTVSGKYLYIRDTEIEGHEINTSSGTAASGIQYNNKKFALRAVIGV